MKLARMALSALVFSLGAAAPVLSQAQSYIDVAVGNVVALALNDNGQITGYRSTDNGFQAFITGNNGSGLTSIDLPLSSFGGYQPVSAGLGINNQGQVVGTEFNTGTAFATGPNGQDAQPIGTARGIDGAYGINDLGQIAGTQHDFVVVLDQATDQLTVLGASQGLFATPAGINDKGQVVGSITMNPYVDHAFVSNSDGSLTDLGTLGGNVSRGLAINKFGWVVGYSETDSGSTHAFMASADNHLLIDINPGVAYAKALGINDAGQIIGEYSNSLLEGVHPFITGANGQGFFDLSALVSLTGGVGITSVRGINNAGQLLVEGFDGQTHLLTPVVPEPGTLALWLLGMVGLGVAARRRPS